jgi:hypothetical protein
MGHGEEYARSLLGYADLAALPQGGLSGTDLRVINLGMLGGASQLCWDRHSCTYIQSHALI